ncbi:MAG: HEAT repeat domain-containing protein [Fimbriiglobus sp.]
MSIAILTQVYTEARRLAIAGSIVAPGDFRLKKLIPPLEQAGKQAPVFAKVAQAATALIEGTEANSAANLLELTSIVNAVLYTQGETGLAGKLAPVETTDLGGSVVQTSARELKPLLEALTSTGSGRMELIDEAEKRGLFRDLRLVKPALAALDDPYSEIAEMIAKKVLPKYGKAILPEVVAKYDQKGTKGHPRRLKLMHELAPELAREHIMAALDAGSKEVKVAAISCLGTDPKDLPYLVEQASAKAQDVRDAAYHGLVKCEQPEAIATLKKALAGKDSDFAASAIRTTKNLKIAELTVAEIRANVDELPKAKDKKKISELAARVFRLMSAFPQLKFPAANVLLLDLFGRRAELAKIKGDHFGGSDINEAVMQQMMQSDVSVQNVLVDSHSELSPEHLRYAFTAARECLTPEKLYDTFSPYITAKPEGKKRLKFNASDTIIGGIGRPDHWRYWYSDETDDDEDEKTKPLDPRWLDLAVKTERLDFIESVVRPGHAGALEFVKKAFDAALKKAKQPHDVSTELELLFRLEHKDIVDAFLNAFSKRSKKGQHYFGYWFARYIPKLPKEAIPRLEEIVPTLEETEADVWLESIHKLRVKP